MDDKSIIKLFWQRDESAIFETNDKYGTYCFTIANNILHSNEDAEECVNDTWLRVWNAIPPDRPNVLKLFLAKITRNIAFNRYSALHAEKRGAGEINLVLDELSECIASDSDTEREFEYSLLVKSVNRFVGALPNRERGIFVRRYFYAEPISKIASRYGVSEKHTSVILNRTRKKLKKQLEKEGFVNE